MFKKFIEKLLNGKFLEVEIEDEFEEVDELLNDIDVDDLDEDINANDHVVDIVLDEVSDINPSREEIMDNLITEIETTMNKLSRLVSQYKSLKGKEI